VPAFDAVFANVFGSAPPPVEDAPEPEATASDAPSRQSTEAAEDVPVPVLASEEEVLRIKHFDALEPDELARLYGLMTRMRIAGGSCAAVSCCCATSRGPWSRTRAREPRAARARTARRRSCSPRG
jgi:uncharacterized protein with von Willebrand factor type A (vWA) domain